MKKGRSSTGGVAASPSQGGRCRGGWSGVVLISLSPPREEDKADLSSLRWRISSRTVRRPGVGGASGSEGLVPGEDVPDRFGEPAGEVDLGDLGSLDLERRGPLSHTLRVANPAL